MACRVRILPSALDELDSTVSYLHNFGPNTASEFINEWENVIERLRDGLIEHRLSRFEPLARLGYHTVLVKGYIVLYLKEKEDVVIAPSFPSKLGLCEYCLKRRTIWTQKHSPISLLWHAKETLRKIMTNNTFDKSPMTLGLLP